MNVFEYAMQMEKDGENYYRELAKKAANPGLKNIFLLLADNEIEHYDIIKAMKESSDYNFKETKILGQSKNIFMKIKEQNEDLSGINMSRKEVYEKALDLEKQSIDFYDDLKNKEIESDIQKEIISKIKEEEKQHYFLIENIIEFISNPDTWLENAEWNHLSEY